MKNEEGLFLIVDDEPDVCWALEHLLKQKGIPFRKSLNGRKALACIKRQRVRLAFVDAKLPDVDGLELARQMREIDPAVPIVVVSGYFYRDDTAIKQALSQQRISAFISKPFQHEEILRTLELAQ